MVTAWFHTGLKEVLALSSSGVAVVAAIIAAAWAIVGVYLGRQYEEASSE
jgi:AAA family ATP:ADP antiporter